MSALARLAVREELIMREFAHAALATPTKARRVLDELHELELVRIDRREQGATSVVTITLTPKGVRVAKLALSMDKVLSK